MELKPYLRRPHFYETDGMNIVWHGNYIAWMEEARTDFMDQPGCRSYFLSPSTRLGGCPQSGFCLPRREAQIAQYAIIMK